MAPQALAAIAPDAPQVREALAQATGNVRAAKVLHDLGDTAAVLPTVAAVLRAGDIPAVEAAELAGELGDDSLVALLGNLLTDSWAAVAAAQAMWRITGHAEVEPVLRVLGHGWPWPSIADLIRTWASRLRKSE